ncbi:MAG: DUF2334 domain-containing protein, partial [bacterium]
MIARLKIEPQYLPDWFVENYPAHIPLPAKGFDELKGEVVAWGICEGEKIPLLSVESGVIFSQYDWDEWNDYILGEKYRDMIRPFYTRLPFHYHHIVPGTLRNIAARMLLSKRISSTIPRNDFPGFPIEQGFELLHHVYQHNSATHGLESNQPSQIILTHDIDTKDGFKWVKKIARLEMEYGFRSLWNVVAHRYKIEYRILDWLVENGFEIGLHGYNHDNKLIFLLESEIRYRLNQCKGLLSRYQIKAFRSPSWFRNEMLFNVLKEYFQYDYSRLDTDIVCPGGNGGCLWTKTFSLFGLTYVPTTLPFEAPLFFHYTPEQLLKFWEPKIEWLKS